MLAKIAYSPDEVRTIGITLNGQVSGWRDNLAALTGASPYTIRSWCDSETSATHRPCSGPAARLLNVLMKLHKADVNIDSFINAADVEIEESQPSDQALVVPDPPPEMIALWRAAYIIARNHP